MTSFDPREHIRGMHQILISDKKKIGFLFGAGTSLATGLPSISVPAVDAMTKKVVADVNAHSDDFAEAIRQIQVETTNAKAVFTIETLLSSVEAKRAVIGAGVLNGLSAAGFAELASFVKSAVVRLVSVHDSLPVEDRRKLAHAHLANWLQKARRRFPAEIFTTNYDYLFEIALEGSGLPYFDGFAGSFEPFFCPEAVEDMDAYSHLVKLWKMHGSLGWTYRETDRAVIRTHSAPDDAILIYPSHLKYDSSKKQPYIGLIDRLCGFLQQDDAVLFTCGYAFGDNHINERIVTSLRRGANSHVFALYYDETRSDPSRPHFELNDEMNGVRKLAQHETAGKLSVYGLRSAVIGGRFGEWRLRDQPSGTEALQVKEYFEGDNDTKTVATGSAPIPWSGTGRFLLPDFRELTQFLNGLSTAEMTSNNNAGVQ